MSTVKCSAAIPSATELRQCRANQYVAGLVEFKEFQELLAEVAKTYSSQKEFAEALGIDPSRLSKAINVGEFAFNPENCLRLAKLSGKPPSAILRAAGKADIAETDRIALWQAAYGFTHG
jgi:hypothetical protein